MAASEGVEYRCFVGGLAWATNDRNLEAAFSPFGEILNTKIINDHETGRSRGFGFVTFSTEQSMRDAIEGMNGKELDGRCITVNEAHSRRSGGGGRGGSRYGGGGGYGQRREDGGRGVQRRDGGGGGGVQQRGGNSDRRGSRFGTNRRTERGSGFGMFDDDIFGASLFSRSPFCDDIFGDDIFGGSRFGTNQRGSGFGMFGDDIFARPFFQFHGVAPQRRHKDAPIEHQLPCSLADLYNGTTKKMKITKVITDHSGRHTVVEEILTIDIKPGWKKGTKITFHERGNEAPHKIPADIVFVIDEKSNDQFTREGNDLVMTQKISFAEDWTRYTVHVTTLDGRNLTVPIKRAVNPGYEEVVPGEGMPIPKDPFKKGNLRIKFNISFPSVTESGS